MLMIVGSNALDMKDGLKIPKFVGIYFGAI
jgi:hypothetical protein